MVGDLVCIRSLGSPRERTGKHVISARPQGQRARQAGNRPYEIAGCDLDVRAGATEIDRGYREVHLQ